jgi:hypothetical protein
MHPKRFSRVSSCERLSTGDQLLPLAAQRCQRFSCPPVPPRWPEVGETTYRMSGLVGSSSFSSPVKSIGNDENKGSSASPRSVFFPAKTRAGVWIQLSGIRPRVISASLRRQRSVEGMMSQCIGFMKFFLRLVRHHHGTCEFGASIRVWPKLDYL